MVNGIGSGQPYSPEASSAAKQSNLGRDDFLRLLVTQMSNQSPLEPMEGTEFVTQLAQFSSLEALTGTNARLEDLSMGQAAMISQQSIGMLGRTITYPGDSIHLNAEGAANLRYELGGTATTATIRIEDQHGRTVRTIRSTGTSAGNNNVQWDGNDDAGNRVPAGRYKAVVDARIGEEPVLAQTYSTGRVSGLTFDNGIPELIVAGERVSPSAVVEIAD